jgi:hypothetical protein
MLKSSNFFLPLLLLVKIYACQEYKTSMCQNNPKNICDSNHIFIFLCGFAAKDIKKAYIRNSLKNAIDWDLMLNLSENDRIDYFNSDGYICLNKQELTSKFKVNFKDTLRSVLYLEHDYLYYFDLPIHRDSIRLSFANKSDTIRGLESIR